MGSAIGTSSPAKDHGPRVADVRDYGAIASAVHDISHAAANQAAFQAAYDAVAASLASNGYGTVYVPSGDYYLAGPIFMDKNLVGFRGEGPSVSNLYNVCYQDIFVAGLPRQPGGVAPTADHFPDSWTGGSGGTKVHDATAVTAAGQRWGLRTKADSNVAQQGGPLDRGLGDGYKSTRQLTVALYVDFSLAATTVPPGYVSPAYPGNGSIMGMMTRGAVLPWALYVVNHNIYLGFRTVNVNGLNPVDRSCVIYTIPSGAGLIRFDFQVDLVNAQISCFVNGLQVAVANLAALGAGFTSAAGLYFAPNECYPCSVGAMRDSITAAGDSAYGGPIDITFWGLKVTSALIYTNRSTSGTNDGAGAGTTQTRLDAAAITDLNRYFSYESANTLARLSLKDAPASIQANGLVSVVTRSDDQPTTAFFCNNALSGSPNYPVTVGPIESLGVLCSNLNYGRGVTTAAAYNLYLRDCRMLNGNANLGALNANTNYPVNVENCYMGGAADANIYLHYATQVHIRHCQFAGAQTTIRLSTTNVEIDHCFVLGGNAPDYIVRSLNGGDLKITNLSQDGEGPDGGPTKAFVYANASAGTDAVGSGGNVHIEYLVGGRQAPGSALVILEDNVVEDGILARPARFHLAHSGVEDSYLTAIVRNTGNRWRGEVIADNTPQRPNWVQNLTTSGEGGVVARHDYYTGPPRDGTWGQNANVLNVPNPHAAQFTQWRCTATGSYGTAAPPVWYGMLPIDDGLSLAAYLQDNAYWAAPSMPSGGQGFWANGPACLFLNALFGGTMPATPSGIYAALGCRMAYRVPSYVEMNGSNGYARVATGAWTISSGGATNAAAITFATATANWVRQSYYATLNALLFFDATTGGNYLAAIDLPPTTVNSGQTLSYAAGAITIARAPSPLGSFADTVHSRMNGFYLNQTAFTAPTIYLALSTAPASLSAPTEPSGGGYARVATTAASWTLNPLAAYAMYGPPGTTGVISNAAALTFAAPSGGWGTLQSVYLMDAATGGNVLGSANLTIPRTINSGSGARSFAVGSLWLSRS